MGSAVDGERPTSFEIYRSGVTTEEIKLTISLVIVARRWRALIDEKLRVIGQSSARKEAMAAIMNSPGPSSQVDIARRLRIEGPTMTRMLDTLERDGLVERTADPADRRSKHLRVTQQGEAALEQIFAISDVMRARLLEGFTAQELCVFNGFLDRLTEKLDGGLPDDAQDDGPRAAAG